MKKSIYFIPLIVIIVILIIILTTRLLKQDVNYVYQTIKEEYSSQEIGAIYVFKDGKLHKQSKDAINIKFRKTKIKDGYIQVFKNKQIIFEFSNSKTIYSKNYNSENIINTKKTQNKKIIIPTLEINNNIFSCGNNFFDERDGNYYETKLFDDKCWMINDLKHQLCSENECVKTTKGTILYSSSTKELCPQDWQLPSKNDWNQLIDFVGSNPGLKLKKKSPVWNGQDIYNFGASPSGIQNSSGKIISLGSRAFYLTSDIENNENITVNFDFSNDVSIKTAKKDYKLSVRCIYEK